ncbi:MAG: Holliday junction resolvase RuvX [Patescibacteria group bacterium]
MNYLGIDWGTKKIGLASGNDDIKIASPLLFLRVKNLSEALLRIKQVIEAENIGALVVGKPNKLDSANVVSQDWQRFFVEIKNMGLPVFVEDEKMTSILAQKMSFELPKKDRNDDVISAVLILQTFFDGNKQK